MNAGYDLDALADVYIGTQGGSIRPRVLWRMTIRDAQAMCSDPATAGTGAYGAEWACFWTAHDLVDAKWDSFVADDGRFAPLMERLGVTVVMSRQMLIDGTAVIPIPAIVPPVRLPGAPMQLGLFQEEAA